METVSKATGFKINKWGVSGLIAWLLSYLATAICMKAFGGERSTCLLPFILLDLSAVACSIVAAVRGNKWWFLLSVIAAALVFQACAALLTS